MNQISGQQGQSQQNTLAIVSLIAGILSWLILPVIGSLVAIVTGHKARQAIRLDARQSGDVMAIIGLVLGYSSLVLVVIAILLVTIGGVVLFSQ